MADTEVSFLIKIFPIDCKNSYCYKHHKHSVTGDLSFISNNKLRKLFSKGPNYCKNKTINSLNAKVAII